MKLRDTFETLTTPAKVNGVNGWSRSSPGFRATESSILDALQLRYDQLVQRGEGELAPFAVRFPNGEARTFGPGVPASSIEVVNDAGRTALATLDDLAVAEAYMNGDLDLGGDVMEILKYRPLLRDRRVLRYLWSTYLRAAVFGQVRADKKGIGSHYDVDARFFELWLDKDIRSYSHGFFENDDEAIEKGMVRKFQYAIDACGLKPGDRVLDIGGGWGSFLQYAGEQGLHVTSVTISDSSYRYMTNLIAQKGLHHCSAHQVHLFEFRTAGRFDGIVNLGVTEHLPNYRATLRQYANLLKPGRRVYLDAYSGDRFAMGSVVTKWVFEGNTSPLHLPTYLKEVADTDFEVALLQDDTHNYYLTCKKWAENLDRAADEIARRWNPVLYRRFRLYLYGCARAFLDGLLGAHRMILQHRPGLRTSRTRWGWRLSR